MSKGTNNIGKAILGTGLASAFCGLMLYGAGQVLSLLFRDVDPDRIGDSETADPDRIESEMAADEPEVIE